MGAQKKYDVLLNFLTDICAGSQSGTRVWWEDGGAVGRGDVRWNSGEIKPKRGFYCY